MRQKGTLIRRRRVEHASVSVDPALIATIAADLRENGGAYMPRANWLLLDAEATSTEVDGLFPEAFAESAIAERMATSEEMLDAWIGSGQMQPALGASSERYRPFLTGHDPLGLWDANVGDEAVAAGLFDADLGSILDLNLLSTFAPRRERTLVVEVGGGYGRTAEAALNVFEGHKWVMVDAVPGSLAYAREYLGRACPDSAIGFYYDGDPFDLDRFDCYIVPAWRFEELSGATRYDACVNIESLQEMTQDAVDGYLELFDRVVAEEGVVYLSNAHDYVFTGEWNYPSRWRRLFQANTPRSWTRDHPTEIFTPAPGDHRAVNAAIEAAYRHSLPAAG